MSIEAMLWAWDTPTPLTPTERYVLLAICNGVNDQHGYTYGSAAFFARKTGYTERSVRNTIDALAAKGVIRVTERSGRSSLIHPVFTPITLFPTPTPEGRSGVKDVQGARPGPLNEVQATPERGSVDPVKEPPSEGSSEPSSGRATRIAAGWTPGELGFAYARKEGMDDAEAQREAERFRDHFSARGGQAARMLDWQACWRNWVRRAVDMKGRTNGRQSASAQRADERRDNLRRASESAQRLSAIYDG